MAWDPLQSEVSSAVAAKARVLVPLLESIAREVAERDRVLDRIERALAELEKARLGASALAVRLIADAAVQRRELRHASAELQRLGCVLIHRRPPTIYVTGEKAGNGALWLWQTSDGSASR